MNHQNHILHKLLSIIGIVLCVVLVPILIFNVTLLIQGFTGQGIPTILNHFPMIVATDSMAPQLRSGDLAIFHKVEPTTIKTGDIVCVLDPNGNGQATLVYRIMDSYFDENGDLGWMVKLDTNPSQDTLTISNKQLLGVYENRIKGLGSVVMFTQTTEGILLCVVCPLVILLGYEWGYQKREEKQNLERTKQLSNELKRLREENERKDI